MSDEVEREMAGASGGDIGGDVGAGPIENEPGTADFSGEVETTYDQPDPYDEPRGDT